MLARPAILPIVRLHRMSPGLVALLALGLAGPVHAQGLPVLERVVLRPEPAPTTPAPPPAPAEPAEGEAAPVSVRPALAAYLSAQALLRNKDYAAAYESFGAMLARFPDDTLAGHAHYWRGECAYARGDFAAARALWRGGLALFPQGPKAPDSLLKIAFSSARLGDRTSEQASSNMLLTQFPESAAAKTWRSRNARVAQNGVHR